MASQSTTATSVNLVEYILMDVFCIPSHLLIGFDETVWYWEFVLLKVVANCSSKTVWYQVWLSASQLRVDEHHHIHKEPDSLVVSIPALTLFSFALWQWTRFESLSRPSFFFLFFYTMGVYFWKLHICQLHNGD